MNTLAEKDYSLKEVLKHVVNDMEIEGHVLSEAQIEEIYAGIVKSAKELEENPILLNCPPSVGDIAAIRADAARRAIK